MAQKLALRNQVLRVGSVFFAILFILGAPEVLGQTPGGLFAPVVSYSTLGFPANSVAVADVNRDGAPDLIVASCELIGHAYCGDVNEGVLIVLLGNGNGTFGLPVTYRSGVSFATSVAVADVNGDGNPDLVAANSGPSGNAAEGVVSVLLGKGDGTFSTAVTYGSGGPWAAFVKVADVNGDGNPDIVVASSFDTAYNSKSGLLGVLLGKEDGTFLKAVTYPTGAVGADSVAVADVNGDNKLDLLVGNGACPNTTDAQCAGVLLGNGDGTFLPVVTYKSGGGAVTSIAVADVNADGKLDLLVSNWSSWGTDTVGVLLGIGDGTFQPAVTYGSGGVAAWSLAVADVNGDDKPDLLVANVCNGSGPSCKNSNGVIAVRLNNGDGTFQSAVTYYSGGEGAVSLVAADVNGDGTADLVVANRGEGIVAGSVAVLLNTSSGYFTSTTLVSSRNPSLAGQTVTFTATVSSTSGALPSGETITFKNGSAVLGTASLNGGTASLVTSALPTGILTITASYAGDTNFGPSTSLRLRQVVKSTSKSTTSTALVSSLNPSIYGQAVTWKAMVTTTGSIPPTGNVAFRWSNGGQIFTIGTATLNAGGVATLTRSHLNADPFGGSYHMAAVYLGDAANLDSASSVLSQQVLQAKTAATITSSAKPSTQGLAVTFTAKITSPTVIVTGPVTFSVGSSILGTAQLKVGIAKFTTSGLPVGSNTVKVTYSGNSNIAKSSASLVQTVR